MKRVFFSFLLVLSFYTVLIRDEFFKRVRFRSLFFFVEKKCEIKMKFLLRLNRVLLNVVNL